MCVKYKDKQSNFGLISLPLSNFSCSIFEVRCLAQRQLFLWWLFVCRSLCCLIFQVSLRLFSCPGRPLWHVVKSVCDVRGVESQHKTSLTSADGNLTFIWLQMEIVLCMNESVGGGAVVLGSSLISGGAIFSFCLRTHFMLHLCFFHTPTLVFSSLALCCHVSPTGLQCCQLYVSDRGGPRLFVADYFHYALIKSPRLCLQMFCFVWPTRYLVYNDIKQRKAANPHTWANTCHFLLHRFDSFSAGWLVLCQKHKRIPRMSS